MVGRQGKFIVHIGLPKTATSTLQNDFFPRFENDSIVYIGTSGERYVAKNKDIYYCIMDAVKSGKGLANLNAKIRKILDDGVTLVLSEEMLTVSEGVLSWKDKMQRLSAILQHMDYIILVTVREPFSASFSYYVEIYPQLIGKKFIDCVKSEDSFGIYRYKELMDVLFSNFSRESIMFYKFEDIINGKLEGIAKLFQESPSIDKLNLRRINSKSETNDYVLRQEDLTIAHYLSASIRKVRFLKHALAKLKSIMKPVLAPLKPVLYPVYKAFLGRPIFRKKFYRPSDLEKDEIKTFFRADIDELSTRFGIDYHECGE